MKKLSLRGLADFMTAGPAKQRTILRQHKYPAEDEAHAKILYYREARDRIAVYHRAGYKSDWLLDEAKRLGLLATGSHGRTKTRLHHNARALNDYARHFGIRKLEVLKDLTLDLQYGDVQVTVYPDLHVREEDQEKIIKLDFSSKEPVAGLIAITSQAMFEAAEGAKMGLPTSAVLYLQVTLGKQHKGARVGSRMRRNIEAACQTISDVWDGI